MRQLNDESRKVAWNNLNSRIQNAETEIHKLTHFTSDEKDPKYDKEKAGQPIPPKEWGKKTAENVEYLKKRIMQFQMSLRLAFNTSWINEQREEDIKVLTGKLKTEFVPKVGEVDQNEAIDRARTIDRLNRLTKARKCSKKLCYGRGYTGINVSTGEFVLCKCTEQTLDLYKLHD